MSHQGKYRSPSPRPDAPRASMGNISLDAYGSPSTFYTKETYLSPTVVERFPDYRSYDSYDSRRTADRPLEALPVSSTTYRDANQTTKLRTEYTVRPRSHTSSEATRRPLSVVIPSSSASRSSTGTLSAYDGPTSPRSSGRWAYSREDPEQYITPASSSSRSRRRIYSSDYTSDSGRLDSRDRRGISRERRYRIYYPGGHSTHPAYGDPRKWDDSEYYDAYSYTNPREQFEKDSAARSYRATRPVSMVGSESYAVVDPRIARVQGSRHPTDRLMDDDRLLSSRHRDSYRSSSHRTPVSVHHDREEGDQSYTDADYSDGRRRRRRRRRRDESSSRHRREHRESRRTAEDLLSPVLGGLATLGLATGYSDDDRLSRSDRHRSRDRDRDRDTDYDRDRDEEYRRRRRRRHEGSRHDESEATLSSDEHRRSRSRRGRSAVRRESEDDSDSSDTVRGSGRPSSRREGNRDESSRKRANEDESEGRERRVVVVDPSRPKEPEAPPKGILKAPRDKFPEDENPIREGVAPLKDAQRNGIPPGARWTKIDRRLVNPAALEAGRERFEERPDYVIVLRVLTKEEIQAYAVKTQEIRGENSLKLVSEAPGAPRTNSKCRGASASGTGSTAPGAGGATAQRWQQQ